MSLGGGFQGPSFTDFKALAYLLFAVSMERKKNPQLVNQAEVTPRAVKSLSYPEKYGWKQDCKWLRSE